MKYVRLFKKYVIISIGCLLYSVGITLFLEPNQLVPGGVTGISVILSSLFPVSTGTFILLLNVPILILGLWKFGLKFMTATVYSIGMISFFTNLLSSMNALTNDNIPAILAGSMLLALGMGMNFKAGSTTGGIDIVVKVIRQKMPYLKTGSLFLIMDCVVIFFSFLVYKDINKAIYAALTVTLTTFLLDLVLYGKDEAKLVYIITDRSDVLAKRLLQELNIGVTYLNGAGAYSGKEKKILFCAVKKAIYPKAEEIVKQEDPNSFMIVSSATEIFGLGYKSYFSEKL